MPKEYERRSRLLGPNNDFGVLGICVSVVLSGCYGTIPIHNKEASNHFDLEYIEAHQCSTMEEIVQKLGVPATILRSENETFYVYEATDDARVIAGLIIGVPPFFVPYAVPKSEDEVLHCVSFRFDKKGVLQEYMAKTLAVPELHGVMSGPQYWGKEGEKCLNVFWDEKEIEELQIITQDE